MNIVLSLLLFIHSSFCFLFLIYLNGKYEYVNQN
jgi:hypothetical protein